MRRLFGTSLLAAVIAVTAVPSLCAAPSLPPATAQAAPSSGVSTDAEDLDLPAPAQGAKPGHARPRRSDATYGGLPEPASWLLMLIGVGMIGGALRGFVVANRALAKLQPEEGD